MSNDATTPSLPVGRFGKYSASVIWTHVCGWSLWVAIGVLCWTLGHSREEQLLNLLVGVIGSLLGWVAGMYLAPLHAKEESKFVSIGQAISAFISGYALSKFDRFAENALFTQSGVVSSSWVRLGLMFSAFLVIAIVVYSGRTYFRET